MSSDASNVGRCDICGKPMDMRDAGDEVVVYEAGDPGEWGANIDRQDMIDAFVRALRRDGSPESHAAADEYEKDGELAAHDQCIQKTNIPDMPHESAEEFDDG